MAQLSSSLIVCVALSLMMLGVSALLVCVALSLPFAFHLTVALAVSLVCLAVRGRWVHPLNSGALWLSATEDKNEKISPLNCLLFALQLPAMSDRAHCISI